METDTAADATAPAGSRPSSPSSSVDLSLLTDATLPIANVSRLMKKSLPSNAKIAKEAKDLVQEATCELIAFITSEANERCATEKRKTINGDDVLYAMRVLGFENYEEVCRVWLSRYRMVSL